MSEFENSPQFPDDLNEKSLKQKQSSSENSISTLVPLKLKRTWLQSNETILKELSLSELNFKWKTLCSENLNVKYAVLFPKSTASYYLAKLESEIEYLSPELSKVQVFGKWHNIPRKQAAYGDDGVTYKFSGNTVAAKPWSSSPAITELRKIAEFTTGESFNFVLVNRYKDGTDYMGEHRDDEKDIAANSSIASFSFGQARDFIFRHKDNRGKNSKRPDLSNIKQNLESGSLLIMGPPTNIFWYHSLPPRKNAPGVRINLTFRTMVRKKITL